MQGAGARAPRPRIVVLFVWGINSQRAVALQGVASRPRAAIICVVREVPYRTNKYGTSVKRKRNTAFILWGVQLLARRSLAGRRFAAPRGYKA